MAEEEEVKRRKEEMITVFLKVSIQRSAINDVIQAWDSIDTCLGLTI